MKAFKFILAGGAGLAALAAAAPASAQYYPGYGGGNVVGQVLGQILGGGQRGYGGYGYGQNSQVMVQRCAAAVTDRANRQYGGYGASYGGYGGYGGYNQGYGQGYGQGGARVVAITSVEQRSSGRLRVRGMVQTNAYGAGYGQGGYGGYGGYGQGGYGGQGNLAFKCNIDYRGRISDIDFDRVNNAYRGGYNQGYGYSPYGSYRRY